MDIIEHFTKNELVELLSLIKNKLNPGGKAIFRTPNLDAPLTTVFANGDFTRWQDHRTFYPSARSVGGGRS